MYGIKDTKLHNEDHTRIRLNFNKAKCVITLENKRILLFDSHRKSVPSIDNNSWIITLLDLR